MASLPVHLRVDEASDNSNCRRRGGDLRINITQMLILCQMPQRKSERYGMILSPVHELRLRPRADTLPDLVQGVDEERPYEVSEQIVGQCA